MKTLARFGIVMLVALLLFAIVPGAQTQQFGSNWTAQYYNTNDLTGPIVATQTGINGVNFDYGTNSPIPGTVNADNFSIRFTSTQTFTAGTYEFRVTSDDGVRVTFDGVVVLDAFVGRSQTTDTFTRQLNGPVNIVIEYFDNTAAALIRFEWFLQGTAPPGVPGATAAPTAVPAPAFTARVVGVRGLAIRTGPYLGATLIGVARPDTTYTIQARNDDEGVYTWYLMSDGTRTGWSSGRYLEVTGDVNAIPFAGSIFDQIDNPPATGVIAVPRAGMNFRRRPSIRVEPPMGQVPIGTEVELLGRTVQGSQNRWYQVRYEGQVGWIYAPFISVRGDLDNVPIR